MGELYGSEYWTYLLPRRLGQAKALELTQACLPIGTKAAQEIGFLDDAFGTDVKEFETELLTTHHFSMRPRGVAAGSGAEGRTGYVAGRA